MRRALLLAALGVTLSTCLVAILAAEETAVQIKTGVAKKVDASAKQLVVMVTRELTFTVTDATKIVQGDKPKTLADISVVARLSVEYSHQGDTRIARKITILESQVVGKPTSKQTGVGEAKPRHLGKMTWRKPCGC